MLIQKNKDIDMHQLLMLHNKNQQQHMCSHNFNLEQKKTGKLLFCMMSWFSLLSICHFVYVGFFFLLK